MYAGQITQSDFYTYTPIISVYKAFKVFFL